MDTFTSNRFRISMDVAPGVEVTGIYEPGSKGDVFTPSDGSWVDPDTVEIAGRPDRVAQYLADKGIDASDWDLKPDARAQFLADLAQDLLDHHEDTEG